MKVAFLAKDEKPLALEAQRQTEIRLGSVDSFFGEAGSEFPPILFRQSYDLIISYISPWIVPPAVLGKTRRANINFHPGPPEYPGIGCFNFALYENADWYGCTAHEMKEKVDTGAIYGVRRFRIQPDDSVESLAARTYAELFLLLDDSLIEIERTGVLRKADEKWRRKPLVRKQLEELSQVTPEMTHQEVERRIKATYFPGKPAPYIALNGKRFEYNPNR